MINGFKELGEIKLNGIPDNERKRKFLLNQTIIPQEPNVNNEDREKYVEIIINLDTEKEEIEIKRGKQLIAKNNEYFFGFELLGRRSKKIYFTTNNLYYHLLTIPDIINYVEEKLVKNSYKEFLDYLQHIKNVFYNDEESKSYFKLDRFKDNQRAKINQYLNKSLNHNSLSSALDEYVSKDILGSTKKNFINSLNVFSLKINNQYITETKYIDKYHDLIYYERLGRFFDDSENFVKSNKICSICGKRELVTGKIDIPTKFYITDKPYFYEDLNQDNAYKSFSICEHCYQEVKVGIWEVKKDFSGRMFNNIDYYVIPKNISAELDYHRVISKIKRTLSGKAENFDDDIKKMRDITKRDILLDFLFWFIPNGQAAAFVIAENIGDIYYSRFKKVFNALRDLNAYYKQYLYIPNINSLYWLLFPNKYSHNKVDSKLYRKEILSLLDSILKGRSVSYHYLINRFNLIFRKSYFMDKEKKENLLYRHLQMNILLTWINRIAKLEGGFKMQEGQSAIDILNDDIKNFFEIHQDIYCKNNFCQGLFILGVLINEILKAQKEKSSTILNKIDFDGLGVRRVKRFIIEITESLEIYDKYRVNQVLHAQMIDRLQGIEHSSLTKDEVVFYILSGVSFGRYLGHKYSQEKKGDKNDN